MTTLFCLLTIQELQVLYTHTYALLTEPSAQHRYYQRLPANIVPGQFSPPHIITVHFPPVQYCPLISFLKLLNLHCLNILSPHTSYMSLSTNHDVPHLVPFYTTLSFAAVNPKC